MARESLLDCLAFAGAWLDRRRHPRRAARGANPKLPYCVARMISKQMSVTGLFAGVTMNGNKVGGDDCMPRCSANDDGDDEDDEDDDRDDDDESEEEFAGNAGLKICKKGVANCHGRCLEKISPDDIKLQTFCYLMTRLS
ncbi:uncharacterized protein LOC112877782 isoform X1 [Panicum hallii]|uniref:uncharacterized protein LOC112877782 isoform X1 n=1 Tax=Panicum hallii TaxID=206008 RepID=UPI000DF4E40B|nr:uncharacterized protein LOC112877782 isoform X1 [Panicum hallii]